MDTKQGLSDLHDFLQAKGPIRGTVYDLAAAMRKRGLQYTGDEIRALVTVSRSPEHVENEHWTVPYVGRGHWYGPYEVSDLNGDALAMRIGIQRRTFNLLDDKRRAAAQAELMVAQTDGRSELGKIARYIAGQETAIVANMELMLDRLDA